MTGKKESIDTSFHLKLLLNIINIEEYPFTKLVIEKNVSCNEYEELFKLLNELDQTYHQQKQEGLLDFSSLFIHFAGMLTNKLSPTETIEAIKQEGLFMELMEEFIQIIHIIENDHYK